MLNTYVLTALAFMLRDPAHAIRLISRYHLHAEYISGYIWRHVFGSQHALVRGIDSTDQPRAKFEYCQASVLTNIGIQRGGLKSVLPHRSAAKQRFASFASPAIRYCLLLDAVALMLALSVTDQRNDKATREVAKEALEAMTLGSIVVAGWTADYTAECLDIVRQFDRSNVDPCHSGTRDTCVQGARACVVLAKFCGVVACRRCNGAHHDADRDGTRGRCTRVLLH